MNHTKVNKHYDTIKAALDALRYAILDAIDDEDSDACHGSERRMLRDHIHEGMGSGCPIESALAIQCGDLIE